MVSTSRSSISVRRRRSRTASRRGRVIRRGSSHVGVVILDADKARAFYETLFGGRLVNKESPWLKGDFYDSAVGGHGNMLQVLQPVVPRKRWRRSRG